MGINDNSTTGYIFEVDLEYPEKLHDMHDYPLAPEKVLVDRKMLPNYSLKIANEYDIKTGLIKTLVPNLMSKKN